MRDRLFGPSLLLAGLCFFALTTGRGPAAPPARRTPPVTASAYRPTAPAAPDGHSLPPSLTPAPLPQPRLTGPQIFGVRPNHPFLFTVTATGTKPVTFQAAGLPNGLTLDRATGRIHGALARPGVYPVMLSAHNRAGSSSRPFRIVVGPRISLTPPLGWNSWNLYHGTVTAQDIRANADAMVASSLSDHGYSYINIDEGWQGPRRTDAPYDADHPGPLTGVTPRFDPDMKALADSVHGRGLHFGLYSVARDPGYAGAVGGVVNSVVCSPQDVQQMADWGVDYLKYDGDDPSGSAYAQTSAAVAAATRDIVFTICSNAGCPMSHAPFYRDISNAWRIGYDLSDDWGSIKSTAFNGYLIGGKPFNPSPTAWTAYQGPGRWLDCDILVVGVLSDSHPSALSADEQYVQVSQDALLASPILVGCDMTKLDAFTTGLLTNDDVLDVSQDALGMQAVRVSQTGDPETGSQVWVKDLEGGRKAVGLYNFGDAPALVTASWADLGVIGPQAVRDLWRQKEIGVCAGHFTAEVPRHGVVLVRLTATTPGHPQIAVHPTDPAPAPVGGTATFRVTAFGAGPLHYQWLRNGSALPGATGAVCTIRVSETDEGAFYRCSVSSKAGRVLSEAAAVSVLGTTKVDLVRPNRVMASSEEGVWQVRSAVDGQPDTFWGARGADPQWLSADLGATYALREVKLTGLSGAADFQIQVASDGARVNTDASAWKTIRTVTGLTTYGTQDLTGLVGTGRYVRFLCTRRYGSDAPRISEFEVYGSYRTPTAYPARKM